MEPVLPSRECDELQDLATDLVAKANLLAGQIPREVQAGIGDLVRSMNCYYSNLIEGHNTHPQDIDRAMADNYSADPQKRNLQLEARAHIEVQRMIDMRDDPDESPTDPSYIKWLHNEFCSRLPAEMLWVENPKSGLRIQIIPGEFRNGDVQVGRHIPPEVNDLAGFMARFEEAYDSARMTKIQAIVAVAAAHHRFLWIHPFYDGNGRVARLMAHAMLLRLGVGGSIWSVARGLARNAESYKAKLQAADQARLGDHDGRGARSEKKLGEFCEYFLEVCNDQIDFMTDLLRPGELLRRINLYCSDEVSAGRLPKQSVTLLREALQMGELERGRASELTGYQERRAREILSELLKKGLLVSTGPRRPVRLGFPLQVVERWFPALYPESSR